MAIQLVVFAAYVAVSVTHLVAMEVFHVFGMKISARGFATGRIRAVVAILRVIVVIYMTVEVIWAVKPGTRPDEDAAAEPLRAVVAVGSTVIGRYVVVAVWTYRSRANVDAELGLRFRGCDCKTESSHCSCGKKLESVHVSPLSV
jgi:hypothetical protein